MTFYVKEDHRAKLRTIAKRKAKALRGGPKTTVFVEDNDLIGIIGEYAFAITFGYKMRVNYKRKGDRGYDFLVGKPPGEFRYRLDVKGTGKKFNPLLVKRSSRLADIFVLVFVGVADWSYEFLGWVERNDVTSARKVGPPETFANNFKLELIELEDISKLAPHINRRRGLDPSLL